MSRRVLLLVLFFGAFYVAFAHFALHVFPFSGDEYSSLLQAELFARGRLHAPAPPHAELLGVDHVVIDDWVRSKYPPGAAALLALGVRLGVPWLITPLEGMVALLAMSGVARRVLGNRGALGTVAFLGAAPLFVFHAASYFSHTASTMWLALTLYAVVLWTHDGRTWRLVLAGLAIGLAFLTRPLDAVIFGAALLSLRSVRPVLIIAASALPFAVLYFVYNALQFGSPWVDGYKAYQPTFAAIYGARAAMPALSVGNFLNGEQVWQRLDIVRSFLVEWTVPGAGALALLGWAVMPKESFARRFATLFLSLVAVSFLFTIGGFDDGARARYFSTSLLPMALLSTLGWRTVAELLGPRFGRRTLWALAVAVWVLPAIQLGSFLWWRTPQLWVRERLYETVASRGITDGVVVVRAEFPTRYARNGPFFDRPVLYVSARAQTTVDEVAAAFPGRPVYEAHEGLSWTITRAR